MSASEIPGIHPSDANVYFSGKSGNDFVDLRFLFLNTLVDRAADEAVFNSAVPHDFAGVDDLLIAIPCDAPVVVGFLESAKNIFILCGEDSAM